MSQVTDDSDVRADEIMKKPYARQITPEEDGSFRGEILEFSGCVALGDTQAEALASLEDAAKSWVLAALENGQTIPGPMAATADYSGKLVLRIPKSLHRKAVYMANREGVSLNQFLATAVAAHVGEVVATTSQPMMILPMIPMYSGVLTSNAAMQISSGIKRQIVPAKAWQTSFITSNAIPE